MGLVRARARGGWMKWSSVILLAAGLITAASSVAASAAPAAGDEPASRLLPADQRFAAPAGAEAPSFQRHILPLLGRLGCNGRACHGSFQGQAGFRLSLFGYDFKADHEALTGGKIPRINSKDPLQSLALLKPTRLVPHKGGKRLEVGGWEYHLLRKWITAGAQGAETKDPDFVALEMEPREMIFAKAGETRQVKLVARWSDGKREDVTPLCRFRSNDESVAVVDES